MLGQFLELALVTDDTGEAWQQLQALGFEPAATGDIWPHAYGVVCCAGLALGLHARGDDPACVVFVRPEVAALHRELAARGVAVESARLGSDVFNELTLREPGGMALRVLEARSFSPPARLPARTALGLFSRLSLPCRNLDAARDFWEQLGYETADTDEPWPGFTITGTPLGGHARQAQREPALLFHGASTGAPPDDAGLGVRFVLDAGR